MTSADLTFSLIVNTVDRADALRTLLHALEHQSYPHFEVIVVVGPTHDNTLAVLQAYEDRARVLRCPKANLSQSRNIGLLAARGDVVAYIDDDAVPCRTWLEQLAGLFDNPRLAGTGGVVYNVHPNTPAIQQRLGIVSSLAEQIDVRESELQHLVPSGDAAQWVARPMGANMAFRRRILLGIGGFDEFYKYIAEETDVALRLAQQGELMHPVREAVVYHVPASSRNRIIFQAANRIWRLATRSQTYFSIKNGPGAGDSRRAIVLRCLHIVHGHGLAFGQLHGEGRITFRQFLSMSVSELRGLAAGVWGGLFRARGLITPSTAQARLTMDESIVRFQTDRSAFQPAVDPVSGERPSITLNDPPLRICLLSKSYPPAEYDGVGRLTNLMARGLFELGHTVHVITGGETERVAFYDGAYVHTMPYSLDRYPDYKRYVNLFHTLNRNHAVYETVQRLRLNDGIQLVDSPLWLYEGLVTALSGVTPVVVRLVTAHRQVTALHGQRADDHRLVGEMEKLLIERSAHVLPNTRATLQAVEKAYGLSLPVDRYTIVPYGLVPAPEEAIRPFDPLRRDDDLTVLFVGRLEKRKGIQDLFEAIPQVLQRAPRARFVIAGGDNSYWDGFLKRTGMDYPTYFARQYAPYAARVTFTGSISDDDLQQLYAACDLFVAPSLYESFGLIYLEAMNYAKPVIGCRAGGIPEVIDDQKTGVLVEPHAPRQLADAIVSLLKSPEKLREMGMAGRQQIMQRFHYLTMAREFERVYRQTIAAFEREQAQVKE